MLFRNFQSAGDFTSWAMSTGDSMLFPLGSQPVTRCDMCNVGPSRALDLEFYMAMRHASLIWADPWGFGSRARPFSHYELFLRWSTHGDHQSVAHKFEMRSFHEDILTLSRQLCWKHKFDFLRFDSVISFGGSLCNQKPILP